LRKIEVEVEAKKLVVDPESYGAYVNRQVKHREEIAKQHKREKSQPGSGRIWTGKVTKPMQFNLKTESNNDFRIKSLVKVSEIFINIHIQ
jgi:hypothetical protein